MDRVKYREKRQGLDCGLKKQKIQCEKANHITRDGILKFRSSLAKVLNRNRSGLSPMRTTHIMSRLRMILNDAVDQLHFSIPSNGFQASCFAVAVHPEVKIGGHHE